MKLAAKQRRARVEIVGAIMPGALYTRGAALRALGLGENTIRRARRAGIEMDVLPVGRQLLVTGEAAIEFCRRVAAMDEASCTLEQ